MPTPHQLRLNRFALEAILKASRRTVSGVAADAGIGQAHLSNVIAGRRNVSSQVVENLARALDVDVRALLVDPDALVAA